MADATLFLFEVATEGLDVEHEFAGAGLEVGHAILHSDIFPPCLCADENSIDEVAGDFRAAGPQFLRRAVGGTVEIEATQVDGNSH